MIVKKLQKIGVLGRISRKLARTKIYKSIIQPHIYFCSSIIFMANEGEMRSLQLLQNHVMAKRIQNSKFFDNFFCFQPSLYSTNVVMNYTEIEGKVREATNDEAWGPTGPLMQELAHATFTYEHFPEVMSMLWKRMLQENKSNWRRTYKVSLKIFRFLYNN
jgi:hypothetical protein